ncbi:MAG: guanine deaminase, partial [Acidobacteriota bacterium]
VLIRATIADTSRSGDSTSNPAHLSIVEDGGLLIEDGRIAARGVYSAIRDVAPHAPVTDWRGDWVLPGFVDTHVHLPQMPVLGRLGWSLLEWLEHAALPEEARMADVAHAAAVAARFVDALASHGTTTASVFGAHFAPAVASLFEAADRAGIRVAAGLVVSDRRLRDDLHTSPQVALRDCTDLIRRFHERRRLLYSVTPRFALSTSEAMLEVCQALLSEYPTVRFQTHLNEQRAEIDEVARLFPWSSDYLHVYERYGLTGRRSIMAHDVHVTASELERLAASGTSVSHCPSSNGALGSGIFPFRRHRLAGVHVALGTDVGGGTGFGMMKEALQAYLMQRVADDPTVLSPADLLYLSTLAGAEALGLADEIGNFEVGKAADFVCLAPPAGGVLAQVLDESDDLTHQLAALFTLAGQESVREVRVANDIVYQRPVRHDAA